MRESGVFMRNSTVHTRINKKNTIYFRLSLIVLLGWGLFLVGYMVQPIYLKAVDGIISTYQTTFSSEKMGNKKTFTAIADPSSAEKDLLEEAKSLKQEKNQEVMILIYRDSTTLPKESNSENDLNYKIETTSEGIRITNFYHNATTVPDTTLSQKWDVSKNDFDLVSGALTIQLTVEEGLSAESLLAQSKGLVELLMTYNAEKEIQSIKLKIKSGDENYSFESTELNTLINTKMIYTN